MVGLKEQVEWELMEVVGWMKQLDWQKAWWFVKGRQCVSARAGVDKYCRGTRFIACLEKEFEFSLLNCFTISLLFLMLIYNCSCLFLICTSDRSRVDKGIGGWDLDFSEKWLCRHVWTKNEMTVQANIAAALPIKSARALTSHLPPNFSFSKLQM